MGQLSAEERAALTTAVGRLLGDRSTQADVRRTMETAEGYDAALWRQLADMGLTGLAIGEDWGGSGAGPVEIEAVMEEAGAALLCGPLLASCVLAAALIEGLEDADAKRRLLPGIASGSSIATVAMTGDGGSWTPEGVAVSVREAGGATRLDGHASYVLHGRSADVLLVLAANDEGLAVFEVDPADSGVAIAPLPTFDRTQRLARITFEGARARRLAGEAWPAVRRAMDLALVALAGEQAGGARRVLAFTVDYAKSRFQFGRAIGSFQAIKHMAADLLLETESAVSAAREAAAGMAQGAPGAEAAVALAAFSCAETYVKTCADAIQMHGGVAFTWGHPAHLYLRRARADAQLFGPPAAHRERFLAALGA